MNEDIRGAVILFLDQQHKLDPSQAVSEDELSSGLGVEISEVRRALDVLEHLGQIREANTMEGYNAWISPMGMLEAERIRSQKIVEMKAAEVGRGPLKLFVSHSSSDSDAALALIRLMRAALGLKAEEIRCTSIDGYRLPVGANTDTQLRREVLESVAFVGIISGASISSAYVLFELGARWGAGLPLAPLLAPGSQTTLLNPDYA